MPLPLRTHPPTPEELRKRRIDPLVDFCFKRILGSEDSRHTLIFFLNSVMKRSGDHRIVDVTLLNPYNEKETRDDKLTVVDIKARDQLGHSYQIEVQLVAHRYLARRMAYGWSVLYDNQLQEGDHYDQLRPVSAIWIVKETLFPHLAAYYHRNRWQDPDSGLVLDDESAIYVLEVEKWARRGVIHSAADEWLKFLWEAGMTDLETLSETLSPEFPAAVYALKNIRDKEADFYKYHARLEYLRDQHAIQKDLALTRQEADEARQEADEARAKLAEKEAEVQQKDQVLQQKEQVLHDQELALLLQQQALQQKDQALEAQRLRQAKLEALLRQAGLSVD